MLKRVVLILLVVCISGCDTRKDHAAAYDWATTFCGSSQIAIFNISEYNADTVWCGDGRRSDIPIK